MPIVAISKISRLHLESVAKQTGLSHTWLQTPEDRLSRDVAHMVVFFSSLWKVDNGLLCGVCSRDDQFYHFYQQLLIRWAESMEPVYGMTDRGDLYKWW